MSASAPPQRQRVAALARRRMPGRMPGVAFLQADFGRRHVFHQTVDDDRLGADSDFATVAQFATENLRVRRAPTARTEDTVRADPRTSDRLRVVWGEHRELITV